MRHRHRQRVHHPTRPARPPGKSIALRRHRRQLRGRARQVLPTFCQAGNTPIRHITQCHGILPRKGSANCLVRIDRYHQRVDHPTRSTRPPGEGITLRRHRRQLRGRTCQVFSTCRQAGKAPVRHITQRHGILTHEGRTNRTIRIDRHHQRVHHPTRPARPPRKNITRRRHGRQLCCCARQVLPTWRQARNAPVRRRTQRHCILPRKNRSDCPICIHPHHQRIDQPTRSARPPGKGISLRRHRHQLHRRIRQIFSSRRQAGNTAVRQGTQGHGIRGHLNQRGISIGDTAFCRGVSIQRMPPAAAFRRQRHPVTIGIRRSRIRQRAIKIVLVRIRQAVDIAVPSKSTGHRFAIARR